jgi:hypothetical protein
MIIGLLGYGSIQAQQNHMTKIKDGTVAQSSSVPSETVILELESQNKGFLAPRMTTVQRDAIDVTKLKDGLLIFNTSTGCINYWSGMQATWLSLCGTPPPAEVAITSVQCGNITTEALQQGKPLTMMDKMVIPVTVTLAGTYDIMVKSSNGYYFYASGTFPTTGNYEIVLQGVGTPIKGHTVGETGDSLTMTINGKLQTCKPNVFVTGADIAYTMNCASVSVLGDLFLKTPLTVNNKITLSVNVTALGAWNISTNTNNGITYSGSGTFKNLGLQQIELVGSGTPSMAGVTALNITSNSSEGNINCPISVNVKDVQYEIQCNLITSDGVYLQESPLDKSHVINVPVKVIAPGKTVISTTNVNGVIFSSGTVDLEFNPATNNIQTVVLFANKTTPKVAGDYNFRITGTPGTISSCNYTIKFAAQPVNYTISCNDVKVEGSYAPDVPMNAANRLAVKVNVTFPGDYSLQTEPVNGVKFAGTGKFATAGTHTIYLQATGTAVESGNHFYKLTSNSSALSGNVSCNFTVTYMYRKMNVLVIPANNAYTINSNNSYVGGVMMRNTDNFGNTDASVVKVENINMINSGLPTARNLRDLINKENVDIIWISISSVRTSHHAVLAEFVNQKKGVLLLSQEVYISDMGQLIDVIGGASIGTTKTSTDFTQSNLVANINDPILNGSFADIRNKYIGNDATNGFYYQNLPSGQYDVLATKSNDPSWAWAIKHKTKGFVVVGDGGWLVGYPNKPSTTFQNYPTYSTIDGKPLSTPEYYKVSRSDGVKVPVENAFFMTNMMEWAIRYAQENVDKQYIMISQ